METGRCLSEFAKTDFFQETGNKLGQALWDFYIFQIHELRKVHADPHPGNFLVSEMQTLVAIYFGCIKEVPDEFCMPYFELVQNDCIDNDARFTQKLLELEILKKTDSPQELKFFKALFKEMLALYTLPLNQEQFDFNDDIFWSKITELSQKYVSDD